MDRHFPRLERQGAFGFFAADDCRVVGHLSVVVQPIVLQPIPVPNKLSEGLETLERFLSERVEGFVQTFFVEEAYRRRGIGRTLQMLSIQKAQELGCSQFRSWSSPSSEENYALKASMGFAMVPGYDYIERIDRWVPGVWFVRSLSRGTET